MIRTSPMRIEAFEGLSQKDVMRAMTILSEIKEEHPYDSHLIGMSEFGRKLPFTMEKATRVISDVNDMLRRLEDDKDELFDLLDFVTDEIKQVAHELWGELKSFHKVAASLYIIGVWLKFPEVSFVAAAVTRRVRFYKIHAPNRFDEFGHLDFDLPWELERKWKDVPFREDQINHYPTQVYAK